MNILKAFINDENNYNINILGTFEEPLFQANQIAKILGINNVSDCVSKYDETEKVYKKIKTNGGIQEVIFLTELGLYNMVFKSKKNFAKKFKVWVFKVIKEIRISGRYELEEQIKIKEQELNEEKNKEVEIEKKLLHLIKEEELNDERKILQAINEQEMHEIIINNHKNKHVIYLDKIDEIDGKLLIKIGSTKDIKQRAPQLALEFGKSVILKVYPCNKNSEFESYLHKRMDKYNYKEPVNNKISRELFLLDREKYEELLTIINNNKHRFEKEYTPEDEIKLRTLENEKLRIKNEESRIENEKLRIEKDIKKIELMNQNPSLTILFNQENKQQDKNKEQEEINNIVFDNIDKIEIEELNNLEIEESDIDEDDEIYQLSAFREKKYTNRKVPKVQQYHPETLEYIKTFNSIIETVRYFCNELHIETFSSKTLKDAYRGNYIYNGFRWNIIEHNIEDKPYKISETVKVFKTRRDLLARINLDKTKILEVYPSQKHAAIAMKHNTPSAICKALKLDTISQGHYWKFYDDCDENLKYDFIKNGGVIPEVAKTITGAKSISKIDFETKKVISTYTTIKEVQVKYNISRASLKNAIDNKTPHNGFYWKYAS